jgi:Clusterin-associated protein-1
MTMMYAGLCERLRSLGCKQVVSMDNFREPNFELVAELLFWLLRRCCWLYLLSLAVLLLLLAASCRASQRSRAMPLCDIMQI